MTKNLYMDKIGAKAKIASLNLSNLSINKRNSVLKQFSHYLKTNEKLILNANKKDISNAKSKNIKNSMIDRLKLDSEKIKQIRCLWLQTFRCWFWWILLRNIKSRSKKKN